MCVGQSVRKTYKWCKMDGEQKEKTQREKERQKREKRNKERANTEKVRRDLKRKGAKIVRNKERHSLFFTH